MRLGRDQAFMVHMIEKIYERFIIVLEEGDRDFEHYDENLCQLLDCLRNSGLKVQPGSYAKGQLRDPETLVERFDAEGTSLPLRSLFDACIEIGLVPYMRLTVDNLSEGETSDLLREAQDVLTQLLWYNAEFKILDGQTKWHILDVLALLPPHEEDIGIRIELVEP